MIEKPFLSSAIFLFLSVCTTLQAAPASTLEKVRAAGALNCGIDVEEAEWTMADAHGNHSLLDHDFCRAVAVAVLGPNAKYNVKAYRDEAGSLTALQEGEIDLLASGSEHVRITNGSFVAAHPLLYDFQGLLVNKSSGIRSAKDLGGKKVCFLIGTEIETQTAAYMAREKIPYIPGPFSEEGEMEAAFLTRHCDAVTADVTQLAYERIAFKKLAQDYEVLSDVITLDPLAPVTRVGDAQWSAIVNWTLAALIQAEQLGITQSNVSEMRKSEDVPVQRLLGTNRGWGQFLGLDDDWAARAISAVGNYGEVFDRDMGPRSMMHLDRGLNRLWSQGGLLYADSMR